MATTEGNSFEIERRVIMFKATTTLPDESTLGYEGDPNDAINGNTAGETLIYNCPMNTRYSESDGTEWAKESMPSTWIKLGSATLLELGDTPGSYDDGKYLRSTTSGVEWATVSGGSGSSDHSELSNLDYDNAGHTGFASSTALVTTSGVLQTELDGKASALIDLSDTPDIYELNKYLRSTSDGTEWATVSGGSGSSDHSDLSSLDYDSAGHTGFASSADLSTVSGIVDAFVEAGVGTKNVVVKCIADDTTLTTGDGKAYFTVPIELNGMNLVSVGGHVYTTSTDGLPTFQIYNVTDSVDMLSTVITIDANEKDSKDAAVSPVINTSNDDVATGDELRFDCDVAGTGSKGMEIRTGFRLP